MIPTISSHLLPLFLQPFSKAFPRLQLYIEEMKTATILADLQNDKLDGAILATPIEGGDFKVHPLYYEPFYIYFSPAHPLLKKLKSRARIWMPPRCGCSRTGIASKTRC